MKISVRGVSPLRQLVVAVGVSLVVAMTSHFVAGRIAPTRGMWTPEKTQSAENGHEGEGTTVKIDFGRVQFYIVRGTAVFTVVFVLMYWGISRVKQLFFNRESHNHP